MNEVEVALEVREEGRPWSTSNHKDVRWAMMYLLWLMTNRSNVVLDVPTWFEVEP